MTHAALWWQDGWIFAALVACRLMPLVIWAPFFGGKAVSIWIRVSVCAALTLALTPLLGAGVVDAGLVSARPALELWALGLKELALGAAVGFVGALFFWAAQMGGALADTARGAQLSDAAMLPGARSPLAGLWGGLTAAVFLATGGHLLVFGALARSFVVLPPLNWPAEEAQNASEQVWLLVELAGQALGLAVLLGLPVLAAVWLSSVLLGVLSRAGGGLRAWFLTLPLRTVLGLLGALVMTHVVIDLTLDGALGAINILSWLIGGP